MYDVLHTRSDASDLSRREPAVIASGFAYSSDARLTVANWVKRHFPSAEYDERTATWRTVDERGSAHAFFIVLRPSDEPAVPAAQTVGRARFAASPLAQL